MNLLYNFWDLLPPFLFETKLSSTYYFEKDDHGNKKFRMKNLMRKIQGLFLVTITKSIIQNLLLIVSTTEKLLHIHKFRDAPHSYDSYDYKDTTRIQKVNLILTIIQKNIIFAIINKFLNLVITEDTSFFRLKHFILAIIFTHLIFATKLVI